MVELSGTGDGCVLCGAEHACSAGRARRLRCAADEPMRAGERVEVELSSSSNVAMAAWFAYGLPCVLLLVGALVGAYVDGAGEQMGQTWRADLGSALGALAGLMFGLAVLWWYGRGPAAAQALPKAVKSMGKLL
ncbi:MAG: SoxR reducing system RseC family protein [Rhodocyclaceae bacterium]|nr:SoxR reducing system RseC family protein [Rhodocyclaceae bacterium]